MRRRADRAVAVPLAGLPPGMGALASDPEPAAEADAGDDQGDDLVTWICSFDSSVLRGRRALVRRLADTTDRIAGHPRTDRETLDGVRKRAAELAGEKGKAGDAANRVIAACVAWEGQPPEAPPATPAKPSRKRRPRAKPAKPRSKAPAVPRRRVERHTAPPPPPAVVAPAEPQGDPDGPLLAWDPSGQPAPIPHGGGDLELLDAALGFGGELLGLLDTEQAAAIFALSDAPPWLYTTPTCWERVEHASPDAQARMARRVRERLVEVQQ